MCVSVCDCVCVCVYVREEREGERERERERGERSKKVNESIWFCGSKEKGRWSNKFYVRVLMDCVRSHLKGKF